MQSNYETQNCHMYRVNEEGERELMANFEAEILEETRYVDGMNTDTVLRIGGKQQENPDADPFKLPTIEVSAESYASMNWVMPNWGVKAIVRPGQGVKDDLRAAIQIRSKPTIRTIYKHLGWTMLNETRRGYLHAGGAITKEGNDKSVSVVLPQELSLYNLATKVSAVEGVKAIVDLASLAEPFVTWPLIAAALSPLYGPVDFAVHLTGRTGTFKSEIMSLMQSFYGPAMDARHLPGSWSSTGNALEAQAFLAANAAFVVDDFIPTGTSWQLRSYQQTADKIIRAQGNQAGRARLTDVSSLQRTMYPRGIILSTGEDTPEGHSVRARMMIIELSPGDIKPQSLSRAQAERHMFVGGVAALIQRLAGKEVNLKPRVEEIRRRHIGVGHTRTPSMIGYMVAVLEDFFTWSVEIKAMSERDANTYIREATDAIVETGKKQNSYLEDADPVDIFLSALRATLANGHGHIRKLNGGIPQKATIMGWTVDDPQAEMPLYKSKGPCIGWIAWNDNEIFLDMNIGFAAVKKAAGTEFALTKQTLFKRLKDAGILSRVDEGRQRNTIRITAENHPRQVVAMIASETFQTQEQGEDDGNDEQSEEAIPE